MVLEIAEIIVVEGSGRAFEAAFDEAAKLLPQAPGFRHVELLKVVEVRNEYRLLVQWDSVDSHVEGFQKSALFETWRALLRPYFSSLPKVIHCSAVATVQ
jgi:heme-degrading monooxygenase HmoA